MKLPQIRLQSTLAQLGLEIEKPVQRIEQPKADLSIEQPRADLTIERTQGKLTIDQTEAWADMNLKSVFRRTKEFAMKGYEDWLAGMARVAQQGDELMRIEDDGNPLITQAQINSVDEPFEYNVGWIPKPLRVRYHYEPAQLTFRWQIREPVIQAIPRQPIHQYTPGKVRGYMARDHELTIDFANLTFKGIHYEQKI